MIIPNLVYSAIFVVIVFYLIISCLNSSREKKRKLFYVKYFSVGILFIFMMQLGITLNYLEENRFTNQQIYHTGYTKYNMDVKYSIKNESKYNITITVRTFDIKDRGQLSYQNTELTDMMFIGGSPEIIPYLDEFDNAYKDFIVKVETLSNVDIFQSYEIKVLDVKLRNTEDIDFDSYRGLDQTYDKYWMDEEKDCEISSLDLIELSNDIASKYDGPIEKAEAIFTWICENIEYDDEYKGGGALSTYFTKKGTCGDFSDLMMALLRIQGIPTRKAYGYVLGQEDDLEDDGSYRFDSLYSHSWIEYFVPSIGWIACDPTYGDSESDYFNRLDFTHVKTYIGNATSPRSPEILKLIVKQSFGTDTHVGYIPEILSDSLTVNTIVSFSVLESKINSDPVYTILLAILIISFLCMSRLAVLTIKNEYRIRKIAS